MTNVGKLARTIKPLLCALLIVAGISVGVGPHEADAAYESVFDQWQEVIYKPGDPGYAYYGNYLGRSDWSYGGGINYFTRHESSVVISNPTSDIVSNTWSTQLKFYHGSTKKFEINQWDWDPCCYVIGPGEAHFGGNTNNFGYGYSTSPGRYDAGSFVFSLCDSLGCYDSVYKAFAWILWQ